MNLQRFLFVVGLLVFSFSASGQLIQGSIAGYQIDVNYQVALFKTEDSSLVKTALCDSLGNFELGPLKAMIYNISIENDKGEFVFLEKLELKEGDTLLALGSLKLTSKQQETESVAVVAKKIFITRKADKIIVNPEAMIGTTGTSALELLEKIPGITVDYQGTISLKGKNGIVLFIDNRPSYLSPEDVANYLRSLPSTSIELIELMSNPPAKFDASGNAGIIHILMKKQREKGLNGSLTLSYGQGRYYRTNNSLNLNYRWNKLNFFSSLAWSQNNMYQDLTINRYYYNAAGDYVSGFEQNSYIKKQNGGRNMKLGCDWYMTKKSTLGVMVSGFYNPMQSDITNEAKILAADQTPSAYVHAVTNAKTKWSNISVNSNFTHRLDSLGKILIFNADYLKYASTMEQSLRNQTDSIDGTILSAQHLLSNLPKNIEVKTAKLDFVIPMKHQDKWEFGVKTAFVKTDNVADFADSINGNLVPNYTFSNRFLYDENNNAAYASYTREFKKLAFQVGLRGERIVMNGNQLGNALLSDSNFTVVYSSLFPTAFVSYSPDSLRIHNFVFSAGRRINYPNYDDMNPFTYPLDAYTYYGGNPFLKPTFSYTIETSYSYKQLFNVGFDYSLVRNLIGETNQQVNGIFYSRPGNFGQQIVYGFNISGEIPLAKWCSFTYYSEAKSIAYSSVIYNQPLEESKWYLFVGPTFKFIVSKKLSMELAGTYQSRVLVGQFLTIPVASARLGMAYLLLKGKGTLKVSVNDMFWTNRPGGDIRNIENSRANWKSILDTRVVQVSFSYRFNKGKSMNARSFGASEEEKNRIKTN